MFLVKNKINNPLYFFFLLLILFFIKFSTIKVFADNYTVKNINIKEQYDINFKKDCFLLEKEINLFHIASAAFAEICWPTID